MRPQAPGTPREGSSAVTVVLAIVVLFGFAALAIDLGTLQLARTELQAGTDAAALAAASSLDRTAEGVSRAPDLAVAMAARNDVFHEPIDLERANATTGVWDPATHTFLPSTEPATALAARVHTTLAEVPLPWAGVAFQVPFARVDADAIAVRVPEPARRLDCYLPVALPQCTWEEMLDSGQQGDHHFQFSNDSNDNVGWAHPTSPTPSRIESELRDIVEGTCDPQNGIEIGGPIALGNGVQSGTIGYLERAVSDSSSPWLSGWWGAKPPRDAHSAFGPGQYPKVGVVEGPVAIFAHTSACGGVRFNGDPEIVAFAWGVIFDVFQGPGQHKGFQMYVDTDHVWEVPGGGGGGGGAGNVLALGAPRLVDGGGR